MSIRAALERVMNEWTAARTGQFGQHPLAVFIRGAAAREVEQSLANLRGLTVKGSAGAGQWAAVPWISVFDDVVTDTATRGYYVVYLFHATAPTVHLSLNQGTTATRAEFKENTREVLRDRAMLIRRRLDDFSERLPVTSIELGSSAQLPADYVAGHAMGQTYSVYNLPSDDLLAQDLNTAIAAYKALTFRGGLDPSPELEDDDTQSAPGSLIELRRYKAPAHRTKPSSCKGGEEASRRPLPSL